MSYQTVAFEDHELDEGLEVSKSNISPVLTLETSTVNLSMGYYTGLGPRYGMAPLPNHNHNELPLDGTYGTAGIERSEQDSGQALIFKKRLFGAANISVASYDDYAVKSNTFFWIGTSGDTIDYLFISPTGTLATLNLGVTYKAFDDFAITDIYYYKYKDGIESGFPATVTTEDINFALSATGFRLFTGSTSRQAKDILPVSGTSSDKYTEVFSKFAAFQVTGADLPAKNLIGFCVGAQPVGTTSAPVYLTIHGHTKEINYKNNKKGPQTYKFMNLGSSALGGRRLKSIYTYTDGSDNIYTPVHSERLINANVTPTSGATIETGVDSGTIASVNTAIYYNELSVINSSYSFFAVAAGKALVSVFQDHVRPTFKDANAPLLDAFTDTASQYIDPTNYALFTVVKPTFTDATQATKYTEDTAVKQTGFNNFPAFVTGVALPKFTVAPPGKMVTVGPANSGVLRSDSIYELAFSVFDKSMGHETNVCVPVRFQTANDDFVALTIMVQDPGKQICPYSYVEFPFAFAGSSPYGGGNTDLKYNWLEYRFYYRAVGSFEWIPALFIDATKLFYDPTQKRIVLCEGQIAGLPGGQPGGFNDYSNLTKGSYFDVLWFQNRCFWMDEKSLVFSAIRKPLAYPMRNAVTCPKGQFKGMIAHAYPGQADQNSRIIIFGSEEIYIGKFKGTQFQLQQNVRIDENTVAQFPIEGTDFNVDVWTSITAFSGRAACVADGILYYWGPTGIRRDNGSELPDRISQRLEPEIFHYYNPKRTNEIFSVYNSRTKEIVWFYRPNPMLYASSTRALVYNVEKDAFYHFDFGSNEIDWAQSLETDTNNVNNTGLSGSRIICGTRNNNSSSTRVVFFDDLCLAGDWFAGSSSMCLGIELVSGSVWRFYFANYFTAVNTTGTLTIFNHLPYQDDSINPDFSGIYPYSNLQLNVAGVFTGKWSVDIDFSGVVNVPTAFNSLTDQSKFFPVYFHEVQAFTIQLKTQYWAGGGMKFWGEWLFSHSQYKLNPLQGAPTQLLYEYHTLIGTGTTNTTVTLTDNSSGQCQIYNSIPFSQQNSQGQAMSLTMTTPTGKYCGSRWVLQYFSYDVRPMEKDNLRHFEG